MGSPASTQRKRFQTSDRIKPETCSCKSPGWRTRPGTDPLIYQQLLAPTSAPPQLNHQRSRRLASYHLLFCTLCFKNTVSPGVHTLSSSTLHTQTPSCAFTPALPAHLPVILSSGVRWTWLSLLLSLRLVSHRRTYPRFITESILGQRKRRTSLGCTLTEDLKRESKGYNFPLTDFVAFFQPGLFD